MEVQQIKAGLIPPTYKHTDSEQIKSNINELRDEQFHVIKNGNATVGRSDWTWFGSKEDGQRMVDAYRNLLLKAFNAEYGVILRKMRATKYRAAIDKLDKLDYSLSNLGSNAGVHISQEYIGLKDHELQIWHNELARLDYEKEQKKAQQEILREQAKLYKNDNEDIEDEIAARESEILKAREMARTQNIQEKARLDLMIAQIEIEKAELLEKYNRAQSQAQITRAGFIYVISNIGTFGNGIVKIGMTRRLEPMDRVKELGDASVPFRFDVHTMAFVHDAPAVERSLHEHFNSYRVNKQNLRREFFQVTPQVVQQVMQQMNINSDWYFEAEAREFKESHLLRKLAAKAETNNSIESLNLPVAI